LHDIIEFGFFLYFDKEQYCDILLPFVVRIYVMYTGWSKKASHSFASLSCR